MKFLRFAVLTTAAFLAAGSVAYAQHSDVEFGYNDLANPTAFDIQGNQLTLDGFLFFEAEMEEFDPFNPGDFGSDEPGFTTSAAASRMINSGDRIFLRILNADGPSDFGVGYVNYYNPSTGSLEASTSHRLMAFQNNNSFDYTGDLMIHGSGFESGRNPVFLGFGSTSGNLHDHIFFDLLDDDTAPFGAYGLLVQLEADFQSNGFGTTDLESDPFWMIWNHGLDEHDFHHALAAYGAVPEPSGAILLCGLALGTLAVRRRRV